MTTTNTSIAVAESAPRHALDEAGMAAALDEQWDRAQAGLVEIIRFGAMLAQVARAIDAECSPAGEHSHRGCKSKGRGLRGWLAEHCPGINYKTAYGYMVAANGLAREARLAADVPLLSLMGADPIAEPRAEKLRARVFSILEGASLSLLKAAGTSSPPPLPTGGARPGAGRPVKLVLPPPTPEEAASEVYPMIIKLYNWAVVEDGWGLLRDTDLTAMLATVNDILKRGKTIESARSERTRDK